MKTYLLVFTVMLVICSFASAADYYISADTGDDLWNGLAAVWDGVNGPKRTIQAGIDAATNNDTVIVEEGIYTNDPNNRDLDPKGKSITIRSTAPNDPNIVANTIIDPNGAGRGFYFSNNEDANCQIDGFTITNAHSGGKGGAVYCYRASPTIRNCIIFNNSSGTHGGGLYLQISNSLITGCRITANTSANDGGGIEWWYGDIQMRNCILSGNQANGLGGGMDLFNSVAAVSNCTFSGNLANIGGGLYCWNNAASNITASSCIFWGNSALTSDSQIGRNSSGVVLVEYSDVQNTWPGTGNIDIDPNFVSFSSAPPADTNTWNLQLKSRYGRWDANTSQWLTDSNTSPCIDLGDPNSDWTNEPWPNGKRTNMGAYGATPMASKNGNIADFNIDNIVDFIDFDLFSAKWMTAGNSIENLNQDAFGVNETDLYIFIENWLWQK